MSGPAIGGWAVEAPPIPSTPTTPLIGELQALLRQYKRRPSISAGDRQEKDRELAILDRAMARLVTLESMNPGSHAGNDGGQAKALQEELQRLKESNEKLMKELFQQSATPAHAAPGDPEMMDHGKLDMEQAKLLGDVLAACSEVFGVNPPLIAKAFKGNSQIGPVHIKSRLVAGMLLVELVGDDAAPLLAAVGFKAPMNWVGFKSKHKDFMRLASFTTALGQARNIYRNATKVKEGVQA